MPNAWGPTWQPRPGDYDRVFREQNPWHDTGQVPATLALPVERPIARYLPDRITNDRPRRFQLILGPRRVGKTTSMYQAVRRLLGEGVPADRLWWLRLDHPLLMQIELGTLCRAIINSSRADSEPPLYLFLDELTYADRWDLWLKSFYDEHWPIHVVGTSSATAALRDRRMESGVGRWDEQYLAPYLFPEYLDLVDRPVAIPTGESLAETIEASIGQRINVAPLIDDRRRFLLTGGFPELLNEVGRFGEDEASLILQSQRTLRADAIERAVYKDIPQTFGIDNPMLLERLLYTLAGQVTGLLSPQSICGDLGGMSQPTFGRYLGYLERAFLVFTIENYSGNESTKQKRGRKLYFVDSAVRNAALQRGIAPLRDLAEMGLLVENMVAAHLHALAEVGQTRLYYWREKGDEVDLIYDHPDRPLAFEIGLSGSHHRRGLHAFMERFPRFRGRCYLVSETGPSRLPSESPDQIGSLPLDLLLLASGSQADATLKQRLAASPQTPP